jgi:hypothetical protein
MSFLSPKRETYGSMNASIIKNGSYLKENDVLEKYWNNLLAGQRYHV